MRLIAIALPLLVSSCVSFTYERHSTHEPVALEAIGELEIGTSDIGEAMRLLGAPLYVWEGVGGAVVLAYGSENRKEVGFQISLPLFDRTNASFNYDDVSSKLEGFVLVFDPELNLKIVRAGLLRELGREVRRRPDMVE